MNITSQEELRAFLKQATTFVLEYKIFMEEIRSLDGTAASVRNLHGAISLVINMHRMQEYNLI